MKPYLIVSGDFRLTGGMDRANYALAQHLADRGNEVHLVAHQVVEELAARAEVTVHQVSKPSGSYFLAGPLLDRIGRREAAKISGRGGRVVVNGGNCRWGDVNWIHYVHAAYHPEVRSGGIRKIKGALAHRSFLRDERLAVRRAKIVFANSRRTKDDLVRFLNIPEEIIHPVYYGVDSSRFGPISREARQASRVALGWPEARPIVVFVGALGDRRKGFDSLYQAWSQLSVDPDWDALLAVVGSGGELPLWKRRAEEAGMADRFLFLGYTRDVPGILAASDVMVHPARYEAYGLGVHEALCRGLPAIVSASAGIAERYPKDLEDLLLPDPESADDLADRLRHWRLNLERYRERIEPLSSSLRVRSWENMAAEFLGVMKDQD